MAPRDTPAEPQTNQRDGGDRTLLRHSPFFIGFFGAIGVLVALALQHVLAAASSVIVLIVVSMFLAVGLNPAVEWLMRKGMRRGLAVVAVFIALLVFLVLFGYALVPVIADQVRAMIDNAPGIIRGLRNNEWISSIDQRYDVLDTIYDKLRSGEVVNQVAGGALGIGLAVIGALVNVFFVAVLTLYFLGTLPRIKQAMYGLVPASRRDRVATLSERILGNIGGFVSGLFVVVVIAGVCATVFLFIVGLGEYAVALGFVVLLLDLIPLIGATIAMVVVSLIGLAVSWQIGLACAIYFIIYQQVENYLIYPRVMSNTVNVPGAVVVIAVLAGGTLMGVVGALLAIPVAAGILLLVREVLVPRQNSR